jgi:Septum formation initiator.
MKKVPFILSNKYFLVTVFFVVWMLFFDQRDFFYVREQKQKLKDLEMKKKYYEGEIEQTQKELINLQNSSFAIEKLAREKYLMKKDGEDIYIIEDSTANTPQK